MNRQIYAIVIAMAVMMYTNALADSGLEVSNNTPIYVLIEPLNEHAKGIGIAEDLIRSTVELRLRQNGIRVGFKTDAFENGILLDVYVGVTGGAYSISISFKRLVTYIVGSKSYSIFAETYNKGGQGVHGGDPRYILETVMDCVDMFSSDFLRTNKDYKN